MGFFNKPFKATKAFVNNPGKIIANDFSKIETPGFFRNPEKATKAFLNNPVKIIKNDINKMPTPVKALVFEAIGVSEM